MERRRTVLLLLFILATSVGTLVLWYLSRNYRPLQLLSGGEKKRLIPTGETNPSNVFYFRSINFPNTTVYWVPIEFVEDPSIVSGAYHVKAILDGDSNKNIFAVVVGSVSGNMQAGSCEYDRGKNTFTGNATWRIENTKDVVPTITVGTKGMLRFYTPVMVTDQERKFYNDRLTSLNTLLSTARAGRQLSNDYLVVPEQICIERR